MRAPGLSLPLSLCPASVWTPEVRGLSESFLGPQHLDWPGSSWTRVWGNCQVSWDFCTEPD